MRLESPRQAQSSRSLVRCCRRPGLVAVTMGEDRRGASAEDGLAQGEVFDLE
jgi:hypothetical protein